MLNVRQGSKINQKQNNRNKTKNKRKPPLSFTVFGILVLKERSWLGSSQKSCSDQG